MNDVTGEELLEIATKEASYLMRDWKESVYGADDIAQEALMQFFLRSRQDPIEYPKTLLKKMVRDALSNARRREDIRRAGPLPEEYPDGVCLLQQWEKAEITREELLVLTDFAKNDTQRGIILHVIRGFDIFDSEDKESIAECLGITLNHLAVQLSRLKEIRVRSEKGVIVSREQLITVVPTCICYWGRRFRRMGCLRNPMNVINAFLWWCMERSRRAGRVKDPRAHDEDYVQLGPLPFPLDLRALTGDERVEININDFSSPD